MLKKIPCEHDQVRLLVSGEGRGTHGLYWNVQSLPLKPAYISQQPGDPKTGQPSLPRSVQPPN